MAADLEKDANMMERLSIYFTRNHATVTVADSHEDGGATRESASRSMPVTIANMHSEDRDMLVRFCKAVIECAEHGDCKRLNEW